MGQAIETVETWESSRNRASLDCGVPKSTLKDGISVRVVDGCMPRPRPYLSPGEEKELLVLAMMFMRLGLDARHRRIKNLATEKF